MLLCSSRVVMFGVCRCRDCMIMCFIFILKWLCCGMIWLCLTWCVCRVIWLFILVCFLLMICVVCFLVSWCGDRIGLVFLCFIRMVLVMCLFVMCCRYVWCKVSC